MAGHIKKREGRTANGSKFIKWRARYPDPLRAGPAQIERTFKTRDEANAWLDAMRNSARSGAYVDPGDGKRTFAAVADEYRTTWTGLEPRTKAGYAHILRKHLIPRFGGAKIAAVTPDAVQRYVNELAETRAPNTVRRIYGVLNQVLRTAQQRRYIATNPCDAVQLPKRRARHANGHGNGKPGPQRPRMTVLTPAEVTALADAMPHYRAAVYVAATCGLRAGELWALRRDDIDLLNGLLTVDEALKEVNGAAEDVPEHERGLIFGPPKSAASERRIAIPAHTKAILQEHLSRSLPGGNKPSSLIFTTPSGLPMRHGLFYRRVFKPAVLKVLPADKHALRFHDLRHTCASLSLAVSPNLTVVKHRLGHSNIATTVDTYGHMVPSVDAALADGLSALFAAKPAAPADNVSELRASD